ncbi:MAG: OB-fold domain-containing protein [Proteobacteria bacterium]|nr:OB-fold domain-containing protein [Pseudomonadota bacterium]
MDRPSENFTLALKYKRTLGPVVGAFLTGLRDGRLVGIKTAEGRVLCPPLEYDPANGQRTGELVDLPDNGTVESWSWVSEPQRKHPLERPFAFATIRIDGADSALVHAVDAGSRDVMAAGLRVKAQYAEERTGRMRDLECFVPIA